MVLFHRSVAQNVLDRVACIALAAYVAAGEAVAERREAGVVQGTGTARHRESEQLKWWFGKAGKP